MAFNIGENVGPYQIIDKLGQGGMATVFKAYHQALDRLVAIKVIHAAFVEDPNFRARFQREARVFARLDHPNIIPVYDFAEQDGLPYLVMKFIDGESLKERMERQRLTPEEILPVLEAVGGALTYAHKQKILHRDVKPSNVILASDGQIYLADFGLARLIQAGETTLTKDGMVGTPQYMSPEQALSRPDLDSRTDLYSLGIMLYELVVGRVPFNSDSPFTIIHDQIYTPTPPPSKLSPDVPKPLEDILLKALAKDPVDRFQEVDFLVAEYRKFVRGERPVPSIQNLDGTRVVPAIERAETTPEILPLMSDQSSQVPEEKVSISPATQPRPSQPAVERKKRPIWIFTFAGAFLLIVGCLLVVFIVAKVSNQSGAAMTPTPQLVDPRPAQGIQFSTPELIAPRQAEMNNEEIRKLLDEVVGLWDAGRRGDVVPLLKNIHDQARDDFGIYEFSLQYLVDQQRWLLSSVFLGQVPGTIIPALVNRRPDLTRQVVYMAAGEPDSVEYFSRITKDAPLLEVALLRHEMTFGKPLKAKEALDLLLEDPDKLNAFPEARLLEVEFYIKMGEKPKAREALEKLYSIPKLHPWIVDFAHKLETKI